MPPYQIKKRNGEFEIFDRKRIENAILQAAASVCESDTDFVPTMVDAIVDEIDSEFTEKNCLVGVEEVQDIVEKHLVKHNKFDMAKHYILYRKERQSERESVARKLVAEFEKNKLKVTKTDGRKELFDIAKIEKIFNFAVQGLENFCAFEELVEAFKKNIVEDIKTKDIMKLLIKTCIDLVSVENTHWEQVAGRFALFDLYKQAGKNRGISFDEIYTGQSYLDFFKTYLEEGLYYKNFLEYYTEDEIRQAGEYIAKNGKNQDLAYGYTTVLSLSKRYLLNPNKVVRELPQELYMSVALFYAIPEKKENRLDFAFKVYDYTSSQKISLATPALNNPRTNWHQLASCFKINVSDDLRGIYHAIENIAQISKFGGGVGVYLGHIRSQASMIRGIKGAAGGVAPWIKVINDTAIAVNQLGQRLGAVSVTLDVFHRDIYDFLELQTETGDIRSKSFDIFPAISVPDLFMKRVENNENWTLFDPHEIFVLYGKRLEDTFDTEFEKFYTELENDDRLTLKKVIEAKDLFKQFLKTTVETGMPYVFFRDTVNRLNPNKHAGNVYSTQLCTEICQNTSTTQFVEEYIENGDKVVLSYEAGDLVTCVLSSINVAKVNTDEDIERIFPVLTRLLDNLITLNRFPVKEAERTAERYRSIGIGYLGLSEFLATRKISYDSQEAREITDKLFEKYTFHTYKASAELAAERGTYPLYKGSEYDKGILLGRKREDFIAESKVAGLDWNVVFDAIAKNGVRFSYHTAPAPNTSTAGIVGTTAALLPIYKKYFIETNLASPTVRIAPKLNAENFWYYKEYVNMDMNDVIDMISVIYKWVDQSISFEWMIDPSKVSPAQLYGYYMKSWKQGIKTVYYVRSLSSDVSKEACVSCSG